MWPSVPRGYVRARSGGVRPTDARGGTPHAAVRGAVATCMLLNRRNILVPGAAPRSGAAQLGARPGRRWPAMAAPSSRTWNFAGARPGSDRPLVVVATRVASSSRFSCRPGGCDGHRPRRGATRRAIARHEAVGAGGPKYSGVILASIVASSTANVSLVLGASTRRPAVRGAQPARRRAALARPMRSRRLTEAKPSTPRARGARPGLARGLLVAPRRLAARSRGRLRGPLSAARARRRRPSRAAGELVRMGAPRRAEHTRAVVFVVIPSGRRRRRRSAGAGPASRAFSVARSIACASL